MNKASENRPPPYLDYFALNENWYYQLSVLYKKSFISSIINIKHLYYFEVTLGHHYLYQVR